MSKRCFLTSRSPKPCWPSSRVDAAIVSQPLIIDCDPGIDDAIAILLALASPELDVLAITTVAGNVPLANTTANGLRVLDLVGRPDLPLAAGQSDHLYEYRASIRLRRTVRRGWTARTSPHRREPLRTNTPST